MKKNYSIGLLVLFMSLGFVARATHIVGGEFELARVDNLGTYRLSLNLYFDLINGSPAAEDGAITASIFRKRDNALMTELELPRTSTEQVDYSNPNCSQANAQTKLIRYTRLLVLDASYDDPLGYYVVWERCCRNGVITNIEFPGSVGNTFYLEFPPVVSQGQTLANSSPKFEKPAGDYICLNQPFSFQFGATDADGDQLRYSLVTPYAGYSSPANPSPSNRGSSNYPLIDWRQGINLTNIIPGPQPLRINSATGQLTVTTNRSGLYVFSVLCEEFRNNVKIGAVRRDFQLLAIDCPVNNAPAVRLREVGKGEFYASRDTLVIRADDQRCFNLLLTDPDPRTTMNIALLPINFTDRSLVSLAPASGFLNGPDDTLRTQLCWNNCAQSEGRQPLVFNLVARDQGCPAPQTDTLLVKIIFEPKPNRRPAISTDLPLNAATVLDTTSLRFLVTGQDEDLDNITLEAKGQGFDLQSVGMSFANGSAVGTLTTPFVWKPPCSLTDNAMYLVDFTVKDNRCNRPQTSVITVTLTHRQSPNQAPTVRTTLPGNRAEFTLGATDTLSSVPLSKAILFDVIGEDTDPDNITLTARGRGFNLADLGMRFTEKSGVNRVVSPFAWEPDCSALQGKLEAEYIIDFISTDNTCASNRFDTVTVNLLIRDVIAEYEFKPANVFTPNQDGKNDYFTMQSEEFNARNLPADNCQEKFERIEIYNRWGRLVFQSSSRQFKWSGEEYPTGDYFYVITYTRHRYKGVVALIE